MAHALKDDEQALILARRGGAGAVGSQACALLEPLRRAERKTARVRLSYAL
jgi:hypothetical protein